MWHRNLVQACVRSEFIWVTHTQQKTNVFLFTNSLMPPTLQGSRRSNTSGLPYHRGTSTHTCRLTSDLPPWSPWQRERFWSLFWTWGNIESKISKVAKASQIRPVFCVLPLCKRFGSLWLCIQWDCTSYSVGLGVFDQQRVTLSGENSAFLLTN